MNPDKIALFDMDGSIADFEGAMRRDLNLLKGPLEPELQGGDLWTLETQDHIRHRMRMIKSQPGWWLELPVIQKGMQILDLARAIGFKCDILTKGPSSHPTAWKEKVEWCKRYVPDAEIHIVTNKGIVYGTMLYDDYSEYMASWLLHRPRGLGIMPVKNGVKALDHPNVVHWDGTNLDAARDAMERAYARGTKEPLVLR